jgi:hypothetical protein
VLQDANQKTGDDVDDRDQDTGDRVALRETGCAVHGAVKFGFAGNHLAPGARFVLVDEACVEVGVDRHLLARHGIQGEARRHFRDTHRAVVDDDELDSDQDEEDHDADHVIAADHEIPE